MPQKPPDDLFSSDELPNDLFTSEPEKPASKASKSFLDSVSDYIPQSVKSGYDFATKPLVDLTSYGKSFSDFITNPESIDQWNPALPYIKGFVGGAGEGLSNVISGFTSPLNLATIGAFKGASSLAETAPMAARALGLTGRALSAPVFAHGAASALDPNKSASERLFGVSEAAAGGAGMFHMPGVKKPGISGIIPEAEPNLGDLTSQRLSELQRPPASEVAPETGLARTEPKPQIAIPELVEDIPTSLKDRDTRVASGEKVPNYDKTSDNGNLIWVDNLHAKGFGGYTDARTVRFIEDTARMVGERQVADAEPGVKEARKAENDDWVNRVNETANYEGKFTEAGPNTRPLTDAELTPEQLAVRKSYQDIQNHSDEYGRNFSVEEEKLPEGEYYKPPPEVEAAYNAEKERLTAIHEQNVARLQQAPDEVSQLEAGIPPEMQQSFQAEGGTESVSNASGESAASAEALSRQKGMRDRGEQYVVYDKAGRKRVLIGPEAVDYNPQPGETYGIETQRGFVKLTDNGGNTSTAGRVIARRRREYPGYQGQQQPTGAPRLASEFSPVEQQPTSTSPSGAGGSNVPPTAGGPPNFQPPPPIPPNTPPQVKQGLIRRALGFNKELLTSWDLSAPGRQGKAFMLNKAWWTSLDDMIKAWGSSAAAKQIADSIENHPSGLFKSQLNAAGNPIHGTSFAEKMGLHLPPAEEVFNSQTGKIIRKYTGVAKSSRAHTAFLNKLRSDQFASFVEQAQAVGRNPMVDQVLAKQYAKFINDATGRGSLNVGSWKLEHNANVLNDMFFAPRNLSGQIRTWNAVLNPMKYAQADPVLRKQALKSLFAIAGAGLAAGELARMGGAQVSNDPTNSDFRKIKIGDSRIDLFGGYQQFPVAAAKLAMGESTSTTTGKTTNLMSNRFGQQTRASVAERFFTNRLGPLPSFVWAWMNNREFDGKPFEVKKALFERTVPIVLKDMQELSQENPALAAMLAPTSILGLTGTQTYTGR